MNINKNSLKNVNKFLDFNDFCVSENIEHYLSALDNKKIKELPFLITDDVSLSTKYIVNCLSFDDNDEFGVYAVLDRMSFDDMVIPFCVDNHNGVICYDIQQDKLLYVSEDEYNFSDVLTTQGDIYSVSDFFEDLLDFVEV